MYAWEAPNYPPPLFSNKWFHLVMWLALMNNVSFYCSYNWFVVDFPFGSGRFSGSEDEHSVSSSTCEQDILQNGLLSQENGTKNDVNESVAPETYEKHLDSVATRSFCESGVFIGLDAPDSVFSPSKGERFDINLWCMFWLKNSHWCTMWISLPALSCYYLLL